MKMVPSIAAFLTLATLSSPAGAVCSAESVRRIVDDSKWCFSNADQDARNNLLAACIRDADIVRKGFRGCQGDSGPRDNFDSCTAGQQIDAVRAALAEIGSPCNN